MASHEVVSDAIIEDLILELSLASALPIGLAGRNLTYAASAANSLAYYTSNMPPKQLKKLEHAIQPLLILLHADIDNPVSAKAALGLKILMASRVCLLRFVELNGLIVVSKILDALMGFNMIDLKSASVHRSIVENCSVCYRFLILIISLFTLS